MMSKNSDLIKALSALEPVLNTEGKKGIKAILGIQEMFPGEKLSDIEKQIGALLQTTRTTLPIMKERALALCAGEAPSDLTSFLSDAKSLTPTDLKALGKQLKLALEGSKADMLGHLEAWITSRGEIMPPDPLEQEKALGKELGELAKPLMSQLHQENLKQITQLTNDAYKELKKPAGFKEYATALGLEVSGSKAVMKKSLLNMLNRIAVSQKQTDF